MQSISADAEGFSAEYSNFISGFVEDWREPPSRCLKNASETKRDLVIPIGRYLLLVKAVIDLEESKSAEESDP
jgi:hypothetical protein